MSTDLDSKKIQIPDGNMKPKQTRVVIQSMPYCDVTWNTPHSTEKHGTFRSPAYRQQRIDSSSSMTATAAALTYSSGVSEGSRTYAVLYAIWITNERDASLSVVYMYKN